MQTERIILRPRAPGEAIDLGLLLARANWPALLGLILIGLLPLAGLAALAGLWSPVLSLIVLWWFKPALDRALLHQLSNDLLGRPAGLRAVLGQWRQWSQGGLLASLLWFRLHPARSAVLPIWQLERLTGARRARRSRVLAWNDRGAGSGLTFAVALIETALVFSLLVTLGALAPAAWTDGLAFWDWLQIKDDFSDLWWVVALAYLPVMVLIEPFYVGAGFGVYLNQRCRLECWDLEPDIEALVERHQARRAA